ncbi:hypothetical protein ACFP65_07895 [Marinilactibacillus sp. GCM10026970]|uniref:hypothetical protein n=1 Tax=Marinilactibacillus sp. GCM10026970 TaxID=3252642 RepID=UPI00360F16A7
MKDNSRKTLFILVILLVFIRVGGAFLRSGLGSSSSNLSGIQQIIILVSTIGFWGLVYWYLRNKRHK